MNRLFSPFVALGLIAVCAPAASGQVLGTYSWQMQPYCNVVTLTLTSAPAGFTLDGVDNQCGATNQASAVGVASFNASGNVTLNFSIVTAPAGKPVHVSAVVSPANGGGTWTDSVGNTGTFAFFAQTPGLPARPLPASGLTAASVTHVELAPNAVTGASVVDGSLTMADIGNAPRVAATSVSSLVTIPITPVVVRTLTMTAPAAGSILVTASGTFRFSGTAAGEEGIRCSLSTSTAEDLSHFFFSTDSGSTSVESADAFGAQRLFSVAAGSFTVNLVCTRFAGTATQMSNTLLTGLFIAS